MKGFVGIIISLLFLWLVLVSPSSTLARRLLVTNEVLTPKECQPGTRLPRKSPKPSGHVGVPAAPCEIIFFPPCPKC
ncbi:hypothetical protein M5689_000529 [Euphorbia peplus]|nr:hypothetical protein M5689_000529 [Euphorbia peplus]